MLVAALGCAPSPAPPPPDAAAAAPRSCLGRSPTCGAAGDRDCCGSPLVPGGRFDRNNDPALPATISAFRLDEYEVTVGRFRAFVHEYDAWRAQGQPFVGAGAHPALSGSGWQAAFHQALPTSAEVLRSVLKCDQDNRTWTAQPGDNETRPINCVSWYEAFAFCVWDGGRLPTDAEWNFAAAGGDEQRLYPWSVPPSSAAIGPDLASYYDDDCMGDGEPGCTVTDFVPVGSKPAGQGRYGHADLSGNVREWVLDRWSETLTAPCVDCAELGGGKDRVLRGGAWNNLPSLVTSTERQFDDPGAHYFVIGFRCARPR